MNMYQNGVWMKRATYLSQTGREQQNGRTQKNHSLTENENSTRISNKEQGMDQSSKIQKVDKGQTTAICVETRADACGELPSEKGVIITGKKVYMPPLPSTLKKI